MLKHPLSPEEARQKIDADIASAKITKWDRHLNRAMNLYGIQIAYLTGLLGSDVLPVEPVLKDGTWRYRLYGTEGRVLVAVLTDDGTAMGTCFGPKKKKRRKS